MRRLWLMFRKEACLVKACVLVEVFKASESDVLKTHRPKPLKDKG